MPTFTPVQGDPFAKPVTSKDGVKFVPVDGNPFSPKGQQKPKGTPAKPLSPIAQVSGFMANVNRGTGIGDELAAGLNTAGRLMTGGVTWEKGNPGAMVKAVGDDFRRSMAKQRQIEDAYAEAHPHVAALGRGTGMTAAVAVPMGDAAVIANSGRALNMARGATSAGLTSAGYAAADRGTVQERVKASTDAANPVKNPLTFALGATVGALMTPRMTKRTEISPEVIDLRARGVPLTPGQARGGLAKSMEDAGTSLPILGNAIQDARRASMEGFNLAAGNEALAPIGKKVPPGIAAGHDLVSHIEKTLGQEYQRLKPEGGVTADAEMKAALGERLGEIAQDMTQPSRDRLYNILQNRVTGRFTSVKANPGDAAPAIPGQKVPTIDTMDGKTFQKVYSELGTVAKRFSSSTDSDQRAIADGIQVMREELLNAAARRNPQFAAQKQRIDAGWAQFKRLQDAAASIGADAGMFTPAQYSAAVRRGDASVDKGATARGNALGQDLASAGKKVLPSSVPNSGTADRLMTGAIASAPASLVAAGASGGPVGVLGAAGGYAASYGLLKAGAAAYSPEAIAAANVALDARISRQAQAAAVEELRRLSSQSPAARQLYVDVIGRILRPALIMTTDRRDATALQ